MNKKNSVDIPAMKLNDVAEKELIGYFEKERN